MDIEQKNTWRSDAGYIWALIGSAVGFANILSFSAKAYMHGGGAFLVPFFIAIMVLGVPLLALEGLIGQQFGLPLVSAYGAAHTKVGKFFGWLAILGVTTIGGYYILLTGWTVAYAYFAAADLIPTDTAAFLNTVFLQKTDSIFALGSIARTEFIAMLLVSLFAWVVVSRNIQSGIERICSIFLPLLAVIIFCSMLVVCFLPGAFDGFAQYLIPDFSKLLIPRLWLDAFGHIFFSLSLGIGIITGYSRHTNKSVDIKRAMIYVVLGDTLISIIAGFTIFGCLGYMSSVTNVPFNLLVPSASPFEMGFVIFPLVLKCFGMTLYRFIGPLFFFCIFIAGITGVFSIIESTAGNIEVEFGFTRKRAVTLATCVMTILAGLFCFGNGQYLIGALDPMVAGFNMLISGVAEIVVFMWCTPRIAQNFLWKNKDGSHNSMYYSLRYVIPTILVLVFICSLIYEIKTASFVEQVIRWGWLITMSGSAILLSKTARKFNRTI
jgi:NSS family neurotransmitter:Na+ symporter